MITNKIGLEAEFLLRNKDGDSELPGKHGLPRDSFQLLGEIRGEPGKNRHETIANFLKEYYRILGLTRKLGLTMDIVEGWTHIDSSFYAKILRESDVKEIAKCYNIYGLDILNYSDAITIDGKISSQKVSCGLHIHFSSINKSSSTVKEVQYREVNLPLNISGASSTLNLFAKEAEKTVVNSLEVSRITKPVINWIVKELDEKLHKKYNINEALKYRVKGFYETKGDGRFEYRSLPFNKNVMDNLDEIVEESFKTLESL